MSDSHFEKGSPLVSIIMPIKDEEDFIERSLNSVLSQDYPTDRIEVFVVDGMSKDGTREIVKRIALKERKISIICMDNPQGIAPSAMNFGLRSAKGDIIIRVDGHCEIPPDYVTKCVELLNKTEADCVGGSLVTIGETVVGKAISLAQSTSFGVGGAAFRIPGHKEGWVDTVAFGAYRKNVFEKIGFLDETMVRNQDDEFNYRLRKNGGKIFLDPSIRIVYYSRADLGKLWKQYFGYGFWKVKVLRRHPHQMKLRQFVPVVFVGSLLLTLLGGIFGAVSLFYFLLLSLCYSSAVCCFSLKSTQQNHFKGIHLVAAAYVLIHLSYGIGFLCALMTAVKDVLGGSRA